MVECLFILHRHLTRASHPPAAFKHLILINADKEHFENWTTCIADLFNTTLILRKRHFTYRLIAVQKALLREERERCKSDISARHAEGLRERRGRGPACTSPEQTEYSNNYPRFGRADWISTIRQEIYNGFTNLTRFFRNPSTLAQHKPWSLLRVVTTKDDMKLPKDHKEVRTQVYRCMVIFTGCVRCEADLTTLLFLLFKQRTRNCDADCASAFTLSRDIDTIVMNSVWWISFVYFHFLCLITVLYLK